MKNENILTPSKEIYNFELFRREFFNPPQKECIIFRPLPQAGLQKISTPLTCRPPHYSWIRNDQPLINLGKFLFLFQQLRNIEKYTIIKGILTNICVLDVENE